MKKVFPILTIALVLLPAVLPLVASAAPSIWPTGYWGDPKLGLLSCTGNLKNPDGSDNPNACKSLCDLINTAINVIYFGMSLAIFIFAPILFAVGAIMIMFAGANPGMLESGKKTLTGTLIGLIIVLCSYLLVSTVVNVIGIKWVGGFSSTGCSV